MEWCEDVARNIQLVISIWGEERPLCSGVGVRKLRVRGEGGLRRAVLAAGRAVVRGHARKATLPHPFSVVLSILTEPEDEVAGPRARVRLRALGLVLGDVQVLSILLNKQQPFLEVLQPEGWEVLAIKDVVETDLKTRDYAEGGKLTSCRGRIEQARLCAYSQFPAQERTRRTHWQRYQCLQTQPGCLRLRLDGRWERGRDARCALGGHEDGFRIRRDTTRAHRVRRRGGLSAARGDSEKLGRGGEWGADGAHGLANMSRGRL